MSTGPNYRFGTVTLVGFERLKLSEGNFIRITPTERLQIILGTNGSGKSSLLAELTPMPAEKTEYSADGSKTVEMWRGDTMFLLTSTFKGGAKHSFVNTDTNEELNKGGTAQVQKMLVKEYFNIDKEIDEMISGREPFTEMSAQRRREWFTVLPQVSYEFAIGFFNKLKDRLRDTTSTIKLQKKYLVEETRKMVTEEEVNKLKEQQTELQLTLDELYKVSRPIQDYATLEEGVESTFAAINRLNNKYGPTITEVSAYGNLQVSEVDLREELENAETLYKSSAAALQEVSQELERANEQQSLIQMRGAETVQSVQLHIEALVDRKVAITKELATPVLDVVVAGSGNFTAAARNMHSVLESLLPLLDSLPTNDGYYTKATLVEKTKSLEDTEADLQARRNKAAGIETAIDQMNHVHTEGLVTCPECQHSWSMSDKTAIVDNYRLQLAELLNHDVVTSLEESIEKLKTAVKEISDYGTSYTAIYQCLKLFDSSLFGDYWISDRFTNLIKQSPNLAYHELFSFNEDLIKAVEFDEIDAELAEHYRMLKIAEDTDSVDAIELKNRISRYEERIAILQNNIVTSNTTISVLRSKLGLINQINESGEKYAEAFSEAYSAISKVALEEINIGVWARIRDTQVALSLVTEKLTNAQMQAGIVASIESRIASLEMSVKVLNVLISNISPSSGLIADSLSVFIKSFIRQMNNIIRKVWTYPLVISSDVADEITYQFPVIVGHAYKPVPDVKKTSTGQKEIINLAYRIVARRYLGLSSYPLQLDEFSRNMDDAHRFKATELIKALIDQEDFSQLWIVSHDINQFGALSHPEVAVICEKNIHLPTGLVYNKHVEMR